MRKNLTFIFILTFSLLLFSVIVMAGEVTIRFMGWEASHLETQSVLNGIKVFEERNPGVKVEYTPVAQEQYISKLLTMMAGGTAPDVFFLESNTYRDVAARGELLDLTDLVEEEIGIDSFIPLAQDKMLIDGHIYGVSSCTVSPVLYYNKDLFDKAGVPYPPADPEEAWTWDEFVDVAKKLTIKEGGRTQQYGVFGFQKFWYTVVFSNGGEVFNEDYTEVLVNQPKAQEAIQKIVDLRKIHGVVPEGNFLEQSGMNTAQMLQTGRVAMVVDGTWALQELATMDFPVGMAVLPKLETTITCGQAHLHCVWTGSKHKDIAWKFTEFLSSTEYQLGLVKSGLWMPNRKDMYTTEGIEEWFTPGVHPENFRDLVPYILNARLEPEVKVPRKVWDILTKEELEKIWFADQPVEEVTEIMVDRVNPLLKN